jgi:hypothetical protein
MDRASVDIAGSWGRKANTAEDACLNLTHRALVVHRFCRDIGYEFGFLVKNDTRDCVDGFSSKSPPSTDDLRRVELAYGKYSALTWGNLVPRTY